MEPDENLPPPLDTVDLSTVYPLLVNDFISEEDLAVASSYLSDNRSVQEYLTLADEINLLATNIQGGDPAVLLDFAEAAQAINQSALPRFEEYTPLTSIILDLPLEVLAAIPSSVDTLNAGVVSLQEYIASEQAEIEGFIAGGSYTFVTEADLEQVNGSPLPDEINPVFETLTMLNQAEGPGIGGGEIPDLGGVDPQDPGTVVALVPAGQIQEARTGAVSQVRPEDGTGASYFDIAEFSTGFGELRLAAQQVEQSSIDGSLQDQAAKSYLELDASMFSAF